MAFRVLIAAASGMKARLESLDLLANNLANQASPGYKADRESYGLYISPEALDDLDATVLPWPPLAPVVERDWTDHSAGPLSETGNPLDLAIAGKGFLEVQGPGGPLYTRSGALRISPSGVLETQDGFAVLDTAQKPVTLRPGAAIEINESGEIRQSGVPVAALRVVTFAQPENLAKRNGLYFEAPDGLTGQASGARVLQGRLEQSNGAPAESAVRLIAILRQFEMLQRAITLDTEMGQRASEIARVGG